MIRRFWEWLKSLFRRHVPATTEPVVSSGYGRMATSANICLASRGATKRERRNARGTLRTIDYQLRYLRGD